MFAAGIRHWRGTALASAALCLAGAPTVCADPPAPYHLIYGLVRDQYGTPFSSTAQVVLVTPTGVRVLGQLTPGLAPGINYQVKVPMDSGLTPVPYQADALTESAPFKLYVVQNTVTNIPIQMTGDFSSLGQPAGQTRIDLTLGVDSNGDGIPDAWELAFLASLGTNLPLSSLSANMRIGPNGRTLLQQFLLGTAIFDPGDTFQLTLVGFNGASPIVQFPTMTGRSYTVMGSTDAQHWTPVPFLIPAEGPSGPTHTFYFAPGIQTLQVQVLPPAPSSAFFMTVMLQ